MRKLSLVILVVSVVLGSRALFVWNGCGYDCGIISVTSGMAAIVAWFLSIAMVVVSALIWIVAVIRDRT